MIIISCSHGLHLGSKIAKRLKAEHSELVLKKFPDGELYIRYNIRHNTNLKNKKVILVQSFYGDIQHCIIEAIFAAQTAKGLGAKKIILVAPYFPYFRQDKRFRPGECISIKAIANLIDDYFDAIIVFDPHLHRKNKLESIFKINAIKLSANNLIADYLKNNYKAPAIIGPDEESYKWAKKVGDIIGAESCILKKKRFSSYHVKVTLRKKINIKNKDAVIVDDIVSTGHTVLETIKHLKKFKPKSISIICVHGIFVGNILEVLKKKKIKIVATNTIPCVKSKIDVSSDVVKALI